MTEPIRIAVVGHTNAGKTSLLRTLTRRVNFGEVSRQPGTTRHVEAIELQVDGRAAVRFLDTPGLEDAVALREHIDAFDERGDLTPPERIRRFLAGPEAHGVFEQEAKVLRALLEVDAAFLVIDAREPVLPKFRAEIELLGACARPLLPVLNFLREAGTREAAWKELLSAYGLHVVVRFDAAAPFVGAERELYRDLATLLRERRAQLDRIAAFLDEEFAPAPRGRRQAHRRAAGGCRGDAAHGLGRRVRRSRAAASAWSPPCRRPCSTRRSAAPTTCWRCTAFARAMPTRRRCRWSRADGPWTSSTPRR